MVPEGPTGRSARILIADDEKDVRVMLGELLKEAGYLVDLAEDGKEALDKLEDRKTDLLVLDLMMPRIDGWAVLASLKERHDPVPVVVVTGVGDFDDYRPTPEGVAATLRKPFSFAALLGICRDLLAAKP